MFDRNLTERLTRAGAMAVLTVDDSRDAVAAARALIEGGVTAIELTFRTEAAAEAIRRITDEVPGMLVGAGTLLNAADVGRAADAGAAFGVSPGFNPRVLEAAHTRGLPFAPGVMTPSDVELALEGGCRLLKIFPVQALGGIKYLRALAAPFAHLGIRYIPLGGVTQALLGEYLRSPLVACVGGSWLADQKSIRAGNWDGIRERAALAARVIRECRHL